ncbi:MAG TPA: C_GCAxxG_C_C family protein [Dehalococcoidia bacterium]|nr:C_GCAxxG_C_C family protein [Dehalococcoidia bacterium]
MVSDTHQYDLESHKRAVRIAMRYERDDGDIAYRGARFAGATCSEVTLIGFQSLIPLRIEMLPIVTCGLGGGFAFQGEICGVVTGTIMALGLDIVNQAQETGFNTVVVRYKIQKATREFCNEFKKEFGSIYCRDLTGMKPNFLRPGALEECIEKGCMDKFYDYYKFALMRELPSEKEWEVIPFQEGPIIWSGKRFGLYKERLD